MLKRVFTCHPERSEGSHVFEKARFFAALRMTIKVKRFMTHYSNCSPQAASKLSAKERWRIRQSMLLSSASQRVPTPPSRCSLTRTGSSLGERRGPVPKLGRRPTQKLLESTKPNKINVRSRKAEAHRLPLRGRSPPHLFRRLVQPLFPARWPQRSSPAPRGWDGPRRFCRSKPIGPFLSAPRQRLPGGR